MLNAALLTTLAKSILSAKPEKDDIAARLSFGLGREWPWIAPLAERYFRAFEGSTRPRRREVVTFLRQDPGFVAACRKHSSKIRMQHWVAGSPSMQPVAAAETWDLPRIETVAALASWGHLTLPELGWFADLKGMGGRKPGLSITTIAS